MFISPLRFKVATESFQVRFINHNAVAKWNREPHHISQYTQIFDMTNWQDSALHQQTQQFRFQNPQSWRRWWAGKSLSNFLSEKRIIPSVPALQRVLANVYTIFHQLQVFIVAQNYAHCTSPVTYPKQSIIRKLLQQ